MRATPFALMLTAALLAACGDAPEVDLAGRAAALARTVAAEQDHVTVAELSGWLIKDRRDFELIDIRDAEDFQAGRIRDARHIALGALLSEDALATLPPGRKVVIYSNGTAHAAQAALLLRLVDRDAYALLGGFNHWQAYLNDPARAGVAEMDPEQRAEYQAVACFFAGDYVAAAGLVPQTGPPAPGDAAPAAQGGDPLGLGLGLGSDEIRGMEAEPPAPAAEAADPLGLGLGLGLGGEAAKSLQKQDAPPAPKGTTGRLLIKAEC